MIHLSDVHHTSFPRTVLTTLPTNTSSIHHITYLHTDLPLGQLMLVHVKMAVNAFLPSWLSHGAQSPPPRAALVAQNLLPLSLSTVHVSDYMLQQICGLYNCLSSRL